jgi:hypothetical protein
VLCHGSAIAFLCLGSDFRVYEGNKEQKIVSLSSGAAVLTEPHRGQKHYLVLFFDNSSMEQLDQMQARKAASKFIETSNQRFASRSLPPGVAGRRQRELASAAKRNRV